MSGGKEKQITYFDKISQIIQVCYPNEDSRCYNLYYYKTIIISSH